MTDKNKNTERTLDADTFKDITTMTVELTIHELDLIRHATWALETKLIKSVQDFDKDCEYNSEWSKRRNEIEKEMFFNSDSLREKIVHEVHTSKEFYSEERKIKGFDLSEYNQEAYKKD